MAARTWQVGVQLFAVMSTLIGISFHAMCAESTNADSAETDRPKNAEQLVPLLEQLRDLKTSRASLAWEKQKQALEAMDWNMNYPRAYPRTVTGLTLPLEPQEKEWLYSLEDEVLEGKEDDWLLIANYMECFYNAEPDKKLQSMALRVLSKYPPNIKDIDEDGIEEYGAAIHRSIFILIRQGTRKSRKILYGIAIQPTLKNSPHYLPPPEGSARDLKTELLRAYQVCVFYVGSAKRETVVDFIERVHRHYDPESEMGRRLSKQAVVAAKAEEGIDGYTRTVP